MSRHSHKHQWREIQLEIPDGFLAKENPVIARNMSSSWIATHGQRQVSFVSNKHFFDKLVNKVGLVQSRVDDCIFYKWNVIHVLYTDDSIITGPNQEEIGDVNRLFVV